MHQHDFRQPSIRAHVPNTSEPIDAPEVLERFHSALDLVEMIATRMHRSMGGVLTRDELLSAGRVGLLTAARRYDPSRGVPFRAFATIRISGAMLDASRANAMLPRRTFERIVAEQAALIASEGAAEQVFARKQSVSVNPEAALDQHIASVLTAAAVGMAVEAGNALAPKPLAELNPEEALARAELMALVEQALGEMSRREAEIVRLYYWEGQSMEVIARSLDINRSWASRLHLRAMAHITKRVRAGM
jgi:RNA polymerase sigma factor for flagellar operon FliA